MVMPEENLNSVAVVLVVEWRKHGWETDSIVEVVLYRVRGAFSPQTLALPPNVT